MLLGALEAGGTKMVCSTGDATGRIFLTESLPTLTPAETIPRILDFFRGTGIEALGVGSFGPLDLKADSPTYGTITSSPKAAWRNYPLVKTLSDALGVPVALGTDVSLAALAEHTLGAAAGLSSCLYVTVGTGIGGGVICENRVVTGLVHPEFGHFWMRPHPEDPAPYGFCPYHDGCLEGLASGPALEKRWGTKAHLLPADHIAWQIEAYYLAQMCMAATVMLSPERIILGGGVMQQAHLFAPVRRLTQEMLGGYVQHPLVMNEIDQYIIPPGLGTRSGVTGALLAAAQAAGARW